MSTRHNQKHSLDYIGQSYVIPAFCDSNVHSGTRKKSICRSSPDSITNLCKRTTYQSQQKQRHTQIKPLSSETFWKKRKSCRLLRDNFSQDHDKGYCCNLPNTKLAKQNFKVFFSSNPQPKSLHCTEF